ncbi:MAG: adenylosuccinate lyase [Acidobacteria bacterium]|nr:adenylosuccinate lyase [Acidobacteriota bacterium]
MIPRYKRKTMEKLWSDENRYAAWLKVELAALQAQAEAGMVPKEAAAEISAKAKFDVRRIEEVEAVVRHDVIAFTTSVGDSIGPLSRYFHYGLTSSDVVDTALAMLTRDALDIILDGVDQFSAVLKRQAFKYKGQVMIGRTHGIHAEPTTLGLKFALWHAEMGRNRRRLAAARDAIAVGKLSGAVGTFAHLPPSIEEAVCRKLALEPDPITTQVIQRDRHAEVLCAIALCGATLEKIATEIRHLQRTDVREVEEPFAKGQKGSSAMPHKRNPVGCENITGLARLLRGYAVPALENVALWHERDISHSSTERITLPDATTLLDYMLDRLKGILEGLLVYPEAMALNLNKTRGLIYSQRALLALAKAGMSREEAYAVVQGAAMRCWAQEGDFLDLLAAEPAVSARLAKEELRKEFDPALFLHNLDAIFERVFSERP